MIELQNIRGLKRSERHRIARQLVEARWTNRGLEHELPIVAAGYADERSADERLRRIARHSVGHRLSAFAVMRTTKSDEAGRTREAIGMATAQVALPSPNLLQEKREGHGVELSYWLGNTLGPYPDGQEVMHQLMGRVVEVPGVKNSATMWSVTLQYGGTKNNVYEAVGMERVGEPQAYQLGDEAVGSRQLWVATLSAEDIVAAAVLSTNPPASDA